MENTVGYSKTVNDDTSFTDRYQLSEKFVKVNSSLIIDRSSNGPGTCKEEDTLQENHKVVKILKFKETRYYKSTPSRTMYKWSETKFPKKFVY